MTLAGHPFLRKLISGRPTGYSLIETTIVVVILAVLATITIRSLQNSNDNARTAKTRATLEKLAHAITGDPTMLSGGVRVDFGYVGDVGALPLDLGGLLTNPGGYSSWGGPYIQNDLQMSGSSASILSDAWGQAIAYSGGSTISSSGGGFGLTRNLANSVDDLLYNPLRLTILDLDYSPPGPIYMDSISISITVPNGLGSAVARLASPGRDGLALLDSIPIGRHPLTIAYLPTNDTIHRQATINPGQMSYLQIQFPSNLW